MAELIVTEKNFDTEVLKAKKPVLLFFWGDWASPSKKMIPVITEVAKAVGDQAIVGTVHVDEQRDVAAQFHAYRLPMLALVYQGQLIDTIIGMRSKEFIIEWMGF